MIPQDLKYTSEHEWIKPTGEGTVRIGVTDYAQEQLGDVVFIALPDVGRKATQGASLGEVESTKSVSDLYAPLDGEVIAVNEAVVTSPELVNADPYGEGWMVELRLANPADLDGLLDAEDYRKAVEE